MRLNHFIRLLTLLAFALFGGALPVAASGDHIVICGADGVKRIVAYDFETGKPVEAGLEDHECQDCFGIAPMLVASPTAAGPGEAAPDKPLLSATASMPRRPNGLPSARAPPSLIM